MMSGLAMKDIIVRLWPAGPILSSYFGLVKWLGDTLPLVEAVKHSTCIEGARMAFAPVKMHWAKKAADMAVEGPPGGKDHRKPESKFEDILEGACLIECHCSKDIMFE